MLKLLPIDRKVFYAILGLQEVNTIQLAVVVEIYQSKSEFHVVPRFLGENGRLHFFIKFLEIYPLSVDVVSEELIESV